MNYRKLHRWISMASALPLLIIFMTGALLAISPKVDFLQPSAPKQESGLELSFEQILAVARSVPEAKIQSWDDVNQIDVRPRTGVVRVRADNYWEIQINARTGQILRAAPRWKSLVVAIHEGNWFAPWVRTGVFFPAGILAIVLWSSGVILAIQWLRARRKRA